MENKLLPRERFVKVRVNQDDIDLRKRVSKALGMTESAVDRMLWEREAERIENDRQRPR